MENTSSVWSDAVRAVINENYSDRLRYSGSFVKDRSLIEKIRPMSDEELSRFRESSIQQIRKLAKNTWRASRKIWWDSPNWAVSGHLSVELMRRLLEKHNYPDKRIVKDIIAGFDLTGVTPSTGLWDENESATDYLPELEEVWSGEFKTGKPAWMGDKMIEHTWGVVCDEEKAGWLVEVQEDDVKAAGLNVNYMLSIDQSSPEKEKFRSVVHYEHINLSARIRERIQLPTHKQIICEALSMQNGADSSCDSPVNLILSRSSTGPKRPTWPGDGRSLMK